MREFLFSSLYFGVVVSIVGYSLGLVIKAKLKHPIFNPLLIATAFIIGVLLLFDIDYDTYNEGAKYISYFLTPATVCLAIPLHRQFEVLKKNFKAIMVSITAGVLASLSSVLGFCLLFGLPQVQFINFMPKSVTTAIGLGLTQELGGDITVTAAAILITGLAGNMLAIVILKLFRIKEPVAKGLAIGTTSHAIGTTKALEIGEVEGAMSSLAIVVAGIVTVAVAAVFVNATSGLFG